MSTQPISPLLSLNTPLKPVRTFNQTSYLPNQFGGYQQSADKSPYLQSFQQQPSQQQRAFSANQRNQTNKYGVPATSPPRVMRNPSLDQQPKQIFQQLITPIQQQPNSNVTPTKPMYQLNNSGNFQPLLGQMAFQLQSQPTFIGQQITQNHVSMNQIQIKPNPQYQPSIQQQSNMQIPIQSSSLVRNSSPLPTNNHTNLEQDRRGESDLNSHIDLQVGQIKTNEKSRRTAEEQGNRRISQFASKMYSAQQQQPQKFVLAQVGSNLSSLLSSVHHQNLNSSQPSVIIGNNSSFGNSPSKNIDQKSSEFQSNSQESYQNNWVAQNHSDLMHKRSISGMRVVQNNYHINQLMKQNEQVLKALSNPTQEQVELFKNIEKDTAENMIKPSEEETEISRDTLNDLKSQQGQSGELENENKRLKEENLQLVSLVELLEKRVIEMAQAVETSNSTTRKQSIQDSQREDVTRTFDIQLLKQREVELLNDIAELREQNQLLREDMKKAKEENLKIKEDNLKKSEEILTQEKQNSILKEQIKSLRLSNHQLQEEKQSIQEELDTTLKQLHLFVEDSNKRDENKFFSKKSEEEEKNHMGSYLQSLLKEKDREINELKQKVQQMTTEQEDFEVLITDQKDVLIQLEDKIKNLQEENIKLNSTLDQQQQQKDDQNHYTQDDKERFTSCDYRMIAEMESKLQQLADDNQKLGTSAEKYKIEADMWKNSLLTQQQQIQTKQQNSNNNSFILDQKQIYLKQQEPQIQPIQRLPPQQQQYPLQAIQQNIPPIQQQQTANQFQHQIIQQQYQQPQVIMGVQQQQQQLQKNQLKNSQEGQRHILNSSPSHTQNNQARSNGSPSPWNSQLQNQQKDLSGSLYQPNQTLQQKQPQINSNQAAPKYLGVPQVPQIVPKRYSSGEKPLRNSFNN